MRRIELTWTDGEWGEGVSEELVQWMLDTLDDEGYALPDSVEVVAAEADVGRPDVGP